MNLLPAPRLFNSPQNCLRRLLLLITKGHCFLFHLIALWSFYAPLRRHVETATKQRQGQTAKDTNQCQWRVFDCKDILFVVIFCFYSFFCRITSWRIDGDNRTYHASITHTTTTSVLGQQNRCHSTDMVNV